MNLLHALAYLISLALGVGIPLLIYRWLRAPLERTFNSLVSEATEFYLRSFVLILLFSGLGATVGRIAIQSPSPPAASATPAAQASAAATIPPPPRPPAAMEYVWAVGSRVEAVLKALSPDLLWFLAFVTVLAALLRMGPWKAKPS